MEPSDQPSALPVPAGPEPAPAAAAPPPSAPDPLRQAAMEFHGQLRAVNPIVWVVPAIILLNVTVFAMMVSSGVSPWAPNVQEMIRWGADFGPRTLAGQTWRLLASMFLHFGALHLALNMYVLWSAGRMVERLFGALEFALIYLVAGLCGGVLSLAVHPQVVSAGASGAVFGVWGALGGFLLRERGGVPAPVLAGLKKSALAFFGYNLLYGVTLPTIDLAAHVGGAFGGALAGLLLARPIVVNRPAAVPRFLLVAVLSVGVVASTRLFPMPGDLQALLDDLRPQEARILADYQELLSDARATHRPDRDLANELDQKVVHPWEALRARLAAPRRWSPAQQRLLAILNQYMDARLENFEWEVTGLRLPPGPMRDNARSQYARTVQRAEQLVADLKAWKP